MDGKVKRERARMLQRLELRGAVGHFSGALDNSSFGSCSSSLALDTDEAMSASARMAQDADDAMSGIVLDCSGKGEGERLVER